MPGVKNALDYPVQPEGMPTLKSDKPSLSGVLGLEEEGSTGVSMPDVLLDELAVLHDQWLDDEATDAAAIPEPPPSSYQRRVRCKSCKATVWISKASWSDPESDLRAAGWSCLLKNRILTKTLCPQCNTPPPQITENVTRLLLGDIETSAPFKHDLRLSKLKTLRNNHVKTFQQFDPHGQAKAWINSLASCSEQFALYQVDGELAVHPIRCKKRACPICESKRMTKWWHKIHGLEKLMSAPKHVSLSIRSSDKPLEDQIDDLILAWKTLRRRFIWKSRSPWGIWLIEITHNEKSGRWHPHLHIVCNMCFLDHHLLRAAWRKITGGSWDVFINAIDGSVAGEVTKYIAKASNIFTAPVDPFRINAILKGRRLVQPFGKWPKLPEEPKQQVKYLGTVAELVWNGRLGDLRAQTLCEIIRKRWPRAMLSAIELPRPPPLQGRSPKRPPPLTGKH